MLREDDTTSVDQEKAPTTRYDEFGSPGSWARGIFTWNVKRGVLYLRHDAISFVDMHSRELFTFPLYDVRKVIFRSTYEMAMHTKGGKYTFYTESNNFASAMKLLPLALFGTTRQGLKGASEDLEDQLRAGKPVLEQWAVIFKHYKIEVDATSLKKEPSYGISKRGMTIFRIAFILAIAALFVWGANQGR